jgi:hypothetical protein
MLMTGRVAFLKVGTRDGLGGGSGDSVSGEDSWTQLETGWHWRGEEGECEIVKSCTENLKSNKYEIIILT